MASEFDLIRRHFTRPASTALLGVGDDCALVTPRHGMVLAVTTDMLIEGTHFIAGTDARRLGHKTLAVNLSDLAAMGADARWALLSIALPTDDETWLAAFAAGFFALAERFGVELVGGDTTRGPLTMSVTAMGEVPAGLELRRSGACVGDDVWLSGATGEAALALACLQGRARLPAEALAACQLRLEAPEPRLELGGRLRGIATGAIDVSDGLLADLGHILESSAVAAELQFEALPRAAALAACADAALAQTCLLSGGDDYELVFTAPAAARADVAALAPELGVALTRIGRILPGAPRAVVRRADGSEVAAARRGFDHFQP
jgi:thiamine-monophosphate kinase